MIDRIKMLMTKKKVSATQFSEEVGIQRSALSHVLSGRNKPSLDFMLKIKTRYPEIELDWLLLGRGKMIVDEILAEAEKKIPCSSGIETEFNFPPETKNTDLRGEDILASIQKSTVSGREPIHTHSGGNKKPSYILMIYPDNTFETLIERQ